MGFTPTFILRDPKTRKISKSAFRDRVVHHALCNIIVSIFEPTFIYDSHANKINHGTLKAIQRFDLFKRKVSKNNTRICYVLKADIKHYFQEVNYEILLKIIKRKIRDKKVIWLIKKILENFDNKEKGMPLGNLTSQFFANVYLNKLDYFVKHNLRAKYYIRYVDDFVLLHSSKKQPTLWKEQINEFLKNKLDLELHPDKSKISKLNKGINFLGYRIFFYHKLIRKSNLKNFERKFNQLKILFEQEIVSREKVVEFLEGWLAYCSHANTYKYRRYLVRTFNQNFPLDPKIKITNLRKHKNFLRKVNESGLQFSVQKTLFLYSEGFSIIEIANKRAIKESTVWAHLANLIEHNQLSVWNILSKNKIYEILYKIYSKKDRLKVIKRRINNEEISFDEIDCVLASVRSKGKKNH